MHRARWLVSLGLAWVLGCAGGTGTPDAGPVDVPPDVAADPGTDPGPDVPPDPGADLPADLAPDPAGDPGHDVPPIVSPACDPAALAPGGAAVPLDDFFDAPSEALPFPNLVQAVDDPASPTGIRLVFEQHMMAPLLNLLDGFGVTAPFVVPLAAEPDPASLPSDPAASVLPGATVFLVRTDGADDGPLDPERLAGARIPVRVAWAPEASALVVEPASPLESGRPYALVVTRCVRGTDGLPIGRAPAMDKVASAPAGPFAREMGRALRFLARPDVNLPPEAVALVLPTIPRTARSRLASAAAAARPGAPVMDWTQVPTLPDGTWDPAFLARIPGLEALLASQLPAGQKALYDFGAIGIVGEGRFAADRFCDPAEGMRFGTDGSPAAFERREIRFLLTLPREDVAAGRVQPFPVVVFQHAFGVCKETSLALAGTLSRLGLATLAIDAVAHGDRADGGQWKCPIDPTTFLTIGEPVRLWYNFAESVLDLVQLVQAVRATTNAPAGLGGLDLWPPPAGDGKPDLRTDTVGLVGQSMGAFLAAGAMGLDDGVGPAVINVGGGQVALFFAWGMVASSKPDPLVHSFATLPGMFLEIMGPTQAAMDDVEPLVLSPGADATGPSARQVLIQQAVEDRTVPMACGHRLARHLGAARMTPGFRDLPGVGDLPAPVMGNLGPSRTGVLAQFQPAKHEFLLVNDQADRDALLLLRGQVQAAVFLRSFFDDGVSRVIDPYVDANLAPYLPAP